MQKTNYYANTSLSCRPELVKWISTFNWTFFVTLSFRKPITGTTSLKHFRRLLWYIANKNKVKVRAFAGVEWYQDRQGKHIHALIGYNGNNTFLSYHKWWYEHYGLDKWEVYDHSRGAGYYVTKYILKEDSDSATWDVFVEYPRAYDLTKRIVFSRKKVIDK
jgi:hypothetical protein